MDTPETDTGAAFAAGVATATAEQAAADAAGAEFRAELAEERADAAAGAAAAAETEAWEARSAVDQLRAELFGAIDEIRESLSSRETKPGGDPGDGGAAVPAPERKEESPAAQAEPADDKPKRRSYGARTWFGG
jgi:hypothetical protein